MSILSLLIGLLGIILTILLVVGIHEFGHFLLAKLLGVKVLRFSIGFGKALYSWHDRQGTEYVFAMIPLGGYVQMLDETEGPVAEKDLPQAYNTQPFYKKFAIVVAGPLFNLILAFIIYWSFLVIGFTSIIPVIGNITPDSIAAQAGMQPQEEITQINHVNTPLWDKVVLNLVLRFGENDPIVIETKTLPGNQIKTYKLDISTWQLNDLKPDPLESLGIVPYEPEVPPVIGKILPDSPALEKLQVGDKIISINKTPIKKWNDLATLVDQHPDQTLTLQLVRAGKTITTQVTTQHDTDLFFNKHGVLRIAPEFKWPAHLLRTIKMNAWDAIPSAFQTTMEFLNLNYLIFKKLITGKLSLGSLGGPISIFEGAGTSLNYGILPFFAFVAFLSIAIAFINILPIPGLDGGHVLFQVIEFIIRRPVPQNLQFLLYRLGIIAMFLLLTQALVNDIKRL